MNGEFQSRRAVPKKSNYSEGEKEMVPARAEKEKKTNRYEWKSMVKSASKKTGTFSREHKGLREREGRPMREGGTQEVPSRMCPYGEGGRSLRL